MSALTTTPPKEKRAVWPFYVWVASLLIMIGFGIYGGYQTLWNGLAVTNLTDRVPWGLWITHDISAIALGAGAFTFSAVVYLFRIKRFEPIARAAVFVGFIGYTSAMLALAMDIGRPDRFWHPLVYWNVHSVLWEITWCVVLYSTVLIVEFFPILAETRLGDRFPFLKRLGHFLHRLTPVMAVLGMALSLLHQSSLGATYGVLSGRAIWFKPSLPVLFILSAIAGGMSLTLLLTMVVSQITNQTLINANLKREIARIAGFVLLAYLYLKLWDWAATSYYSNAPGPSDALQRLQLTTPYTQTFWMLEVILGAVIPAIVLLTPSFRRNDYAVIISLALIVLGIIVNRWNVNLSGLIVPPQWSPGVLGNVVATPYFPSWVEVFVSVGVLGYALLGFTLGVRYLPIYPNRESSH